MDQPILWTWCVIGGQVSPSTLLSRIRRETILSISIAGENFSMKLQCSSTASQQRASSPRTWMQLPTIMLLRYMHQKIYIYHVSRPPKRPCSNHDLDCFRSQTNGKGQPLNVVRVKSDGTKAYSNSLILNGKAFVPISSADDDLDKAALQVSQ